MLFFFLPWRSNDDTVSTPVHAWKNVNPLQITEVNELAISWHAMYLTFLPTPNRIQRLFKSRLSKKCTAMTTTSLLTVWTKIFFNPCLEQYRQCNMSGVSASSWSDGDNNSRDVESDSDDVALQMVISFSLVTIISLSSNLRQSSFSERYVNNLVLLEEFLKNSLNFFGRYSIFSI